MNSYSCRFFHGVCFFKDGLCLLLFFSVKPGSWELISVDFFRVSGKEHVLERALFQRRTLHEEFGKGKATTSSKSDSGDLLAATTNARSKAWSATVAGTSWCRCRSRTISLP